MLASVLRPRILHVETNLGLRRGDVERLGATRSRSTSGSGERRRAAACDDRGVTSLFDKLVPASISDAPLGFMAFQRDTLPSDERDRIDAEVVAAGGRIAQRMVRSGGPRLGRMLPRRQLVSYYLVPLDGLPPE